MVELWNFLDSYKRKGFEVVSEEYNGKMTDTVQQDVYFAMGFQHFMMSIATNPGLRSILRNSTTLKMHELPRKNQSAEDPRGGYAGTA